MIYLMHRRGIVRDDPVALRLAKRWSKASAVLFAIGAVPATVLSVEIGLPAAAVTAVIAGWGMGQYPWMLVDQLRISDAAGATATLAALLVVAGLAGVIVLPPLAYLLWFTQTEEPRSLPTRRKEGTSR